MRIGPLHPAAQPLRVLLLAAGRSDLAGPADRKEAQTATKFSGRRGGEGLGLFGQAGQG